MLGHGATGQFAIGEVGGGVTPDMWFASFRDPVKNSPFLTPRQQFLALSPLPLVSFGWMESLTEPVRIRPQVPSGQQQFIAFQPAPSPFVATGWHNWLSEPRRFRASIPPPSQPFIALNPLPFVSFGWFEELSKPQKLDRPRLPEGEQQALSWVFAPSQISMSWWQPLGQPVKLTIPGLHSVYQQFLAQPPRLLPTPTVFGTLAAIETGDVGLFGARSYNTPAAINASIIESQPITARMSLIETPLISANVSLTPPVAAPASGLPVSSTITANVSIIEIKV